MRCRHGPQAAAWIRSCLLCLAWMPRKLHASAGVRLQAQQAANACTLVPKAPSRRRLWRLRTTADSKVCTLSAVHHAATAARPCKMPTAVSLAWLADACVLHPRVVGSVCMGVHACREWGRVPQSGRWAHLSTSSVRRGDVPAAQHSSAAPLHAAGAISAGQDHREQSAAPD